MASRRQGSPIMNEEPPAPEERVVNLRLLVTPEPPSQEHLEDLSIAAMEAVEEHAADVLGIESGAEFEPPAILLHFVVEAASIHQVHEKVGHVLRVLEDHVPVRIEGFSESTAPRDREDDLVLAGC